VVPQPAVIQFNAGLYAALMVRAPNPYRFLMRRRPPSQVQNQRRHGWATSSIWRWASAVSRCSTCSPGRFRGCEHQAMWELILAGAVAAAIAAYLVVALVRPERF
jgi:K+-transporting ATPase KdpF subunit